MINYTTALLLLEPLVLTQKTQCGPKYGKCSPGYCCSRWDQCGTEAAHCLAGCQPFYGHCKGKSIPFSTNGRCGKDFFRRCSPDGNSCCSAGGWCGSDDAHCKEGCQEGFGDCDPVPAKGFPMITKCTEPGLFALTFDDGPSENTRDLLDALDKYDIKATFFVVGKKLESQRNVKIVREVKNAGHQIGSHSYSQQDNWDRLTMAEIKADMKKMDDRIYEILGYIPIYMRPPHGKTNEKVRSWLKTWGYKATWTNLDTRDWKHKSAWRSLEGIESALRDGSVRKDSFISLNHEQVESSTSEKYIKRLSELVTDMGYKFVTVGECNGEPNQKQWYRDTQ